MPRPAPTAGGLPPELTGLLERLRRRGIAVGPLELARLQHLLAFPGALAEARLPTLLAALLCKDAAGRSALAREVSAWQAAFEDQFAAQAVPHRAAPPDATAPPPVEGAGADPLSADAGGPGPARPRARLAAALRGLAASARRHRPALAALLIALALLGGPRWPAPPLPMPAPTPTTDPAAPNTPAALCPQDLPSKPVPEVWAWVPVPDPGPWLGLGGGLLLLALAGLAGQRLRSAPRRWLPEPPDPPGGESAPRQGLARFALPGDLLLDPARRRELVWSIDRYVSDAPDQAIDPIATVAASAQAAGAPTLVARRSTFPRQVWLWCDRKQGAADLSDQLVAEVKRALGQANLPLRTAHFFGLPSRLVWDDNREPFAPACQEGAGAEALVAVLSDGRAWAGAWARAGERPGCERLARELRTWPKLVLVDLGDGALTRLAHRWGLTTCPAEGLAAWLAGRRPAPLTQPQAGPAPDPAQLDLWAAACLLGPTVGLAPPDLPAAEALRRSLDLAVGPFAQRQLRARLAAADADPALAAALIDRLLTCPTTDGDGYATRALAAWDARLAAADAALADQPDSAPARLRIALARACLTALHDPETASAALARISGQRNRALISAALAPIQPADGPLGAAPTRSPLPAPWHWQRLPVAVRYRLARLGLGALDPQAVRARPAARHHLVLALLAGAALAGLGDGLARLARPHGPGPFADARFAAQVLKVQAPTSTWLGSPWHLTPLAGFGPLATPHTWAYRPIPNPQPLAPGAALLIGGSRAFPIRPCTPGWPQRVLAVIAADAADLDAGALALRLLDRGAADRVLLARDWPAHLAALTQGVRVPAAQEGPGAEGRGPPADNPPTGARPGDQLLVILPPGAAPPDPALAGRFDALAWVAGEPQALAAALDRPGSHPVTLVWPGAAVLAGQPVISGGPAMSTDQHGITWVAVCGGTFLMGSPASEDASIDRSAQGYIEAFGGTLDERRADVRDWLAAARPTHPVLVGPFEIAHTELSHAQSLATDDGDDPLPVTGINHAQARTACETLGGGLPTEAQWEFAARAGTNTPWSFGDDEAALDAHAWFRDNADGKAHPVGGKRPNGLCLADLHGNVYEWTADCFAADAYGNAGPLSIDPSDNRTGCDRRVVRGGAFRDPPIDLRSAFRGGIRPDDLFDDLGLRCVRSVARQQ